MLNFEDVPPAGSTTFIAPVTPLSALNGELAAGNWGLVVTSTNDNQDVTINNWSLTLPTSTTDNEVLNASTGAINVVFDRDMDPTSFTAADVLSLMGPLGAIDAGSVATTTVGNPLQDAVQTLTLTNITPGTNFNLGFSGITGIAAGTTGAITYTGTTTGPNNTTANLQSALNGFFGAGNTSVSAVTANSFSITFTGGLAGLALPTMTYVGPFTITADPAGTPPALALREFQISFPTQTLNGDYTLQLASSITSASPGTGLKGDAIDANLTAGLDLVRGTNETNTPSTTLTVQNATTGSLATTFLGTPTENAIQTLTINTSSVSGTQFSLTFTPTMGAALTTAPISYTTNTAIMTASLQSALDAILGAGNTLVANSGPNTYQIIFEGVFSDAPQDLMAFNSLPVNGFSSTIPASPGITMAGATAPGVLTSTLTVTQAAQILQDTITGLVSKSTGGNANTDAVQTLVINSNSVPGDPVHPDVPTPGGRPRGPRARSPTRRPGARWRPTSRPPSTPPSGPATRWCRVPGQQLHHHLRGFAGPFQPEPPGLEFLLHPGGAEPDVAQPEQYQPGVHSRAAGRADLPQRDRGAPVPRQHGAFRPLQRQAEQQ